LQASQKDGRAEGVLVFVAAKFEWGSPTNLVSRAENVSGRVKNLGTEGKLERKKKGQFQAE